MIFFSAMTQPLHEPPHRRVAHGFASHALQVAPPFRGARRRALGEVSLKQPPGGVGALRGSARRLLRGQSESPSRSILAKRLTEERLTPNRLAVSRLEAPRLTASTIFRLRSSEYAFMLSYDPTWVKVFAHRCRADSE